MDSNNGPSMPPLLTDEKIFEWEYLETIGQIDPDDNGYKYYKQLKSRYVFEVTNWFQPPLTNQGPNYKPPNTNIKQIEDYVNGHKNVPLPTNNKLIQVKWASEKSFAEIYTIENRNQWNGEKFFMLKRVKSAYFEFECYKCGHTWSTKFGTFKFFIAFKKAIDGFLMEDEVYVRVIAFKQDCKTCLKFAQAGQFRFKGQSHSPEHIGLKYIDLAAFSISNTILKILGYLPPHDKHKRQNKKLEQEQHKVELCGACLFGCCVWGKNGNRYIKY